MECLVNCSLPNIYNLIDVSTGIKIHTQKIRNKDVITKKKINNTKIPDNT